MGAALAERVVVVGGGPAALAAVRGYRAAGGTGRVTVVSDDDRAPYERPALSKALLRGEAAAPDALEPRAFYDRHAVELRTGTAVEAVDPEARVVRLAGGPALAFDGLVLATGAAPVRPPVDGADAPHVHVLRSAGDAERLAGAIGRRTRVTVVGTGFIGCEAAASLAARGATVTLCGEERLPLRSRLGDGAAARIADWLEALGVDAHHGDSLTAVGDDHVVLGEATHATDVVLLVAGVRPRTRLARAAGLDLGRHGCIAADAGQRTSHPRILAAGDCSETRHPVAGRALRVEHWGDALAQGEAAGRRLAGDEDATWTAVPGFWSEIGDRQLKQAAWGDGWVADRLVEHPGGAWTVWYADADGACVGVLTHDRDADYERGRELVAAGAPAPDR